MPLVRVVLDAELCYQICGRMRALSDTVPPPPALLPISEAQSIRRQQEVDFARGSIRYEGGTLSTEVEGLNARYVAGEIGSEELTAAILASDTARS
ncbi:antitoxin VbhA family protein [Sphingomonas hominis]